MKISIYKSLNLLGIHKSWHSFLLPIFESPEMLDLLNFLTPKNTSPAKKIDMFKAFAVPKNEVKVLFLGQDPHASPDHEIGIAFGSNKNMPTVPYRSKIFYDSLAVYTGEFTIGLRENTTFDTSLKHWQKQGIMLLNSALSCDANKSGTHIREWVFFTKQIIKELNKSNAITFVLIGTCAKSYLPLIDVSRNYAILAPDTENDKKTPTQFLKSNIFKKIDAIQKQLNDEGIDWLDDQIILT